LGNACWGGDGEGEDGDSGKAAKEEVDYTADLFLHETDARTGRGGAADVPVELIGPLGWTG